MNIKLKQNYIFFVERKKHSFLGKVVYLFLYLFSLLYGFYITVRNFLYNHQIAKSYKPKSSFLIGVGNISWAGTGKTPFCIWLYDQLHLKFKTAILRRGYGQDEKQLIAEECGSVFSSPDRVSLVKRKERDYNLFILDDGFQYRKLKKDLNIVIMGQREFERKIRLIPASFFREPFKSIRRADILIINYAVESSRENIKKLIHRVAPSVEIYFANYQIEELEDLEAKNYSINTIKKKRIAAFAAIGFPDGFFQLLEKTGVALERKIRYPDHYQLSSQEYLKIEKQLLDSGINTLVITGKDKYHLPEGEKKIEILILKVKLKIVDKDKLIEDINKKIIDKLN